MKITRDFPNHSISLSQHQYIIDKLKEYGFSDCSPTTTPMDPGLVLQKTQSLSDQDKEYMSKVPYLNAVGSLIYLSQCTCPDIAYAVGTLAKFSSNPAPIHWKAVKHVFRYLQGTKDYELVYKPDGQQELFVTYSDSNHGACKDTGRSTGGYVVKIGTGAVSWSSKLQSVVALSTTEAVYIAAVEAGKELKWMRSLLGEFGYKFNSASTLCIDNQSSISVAKNPEHHGRMKLLNMVTKHLLHRPMDLLLYLLHCTKRALTYFTSYLGQYCSYYFDSWTQAWRMTQTRYSGHLLSRLAVSWHNRNKQMPNPYMSGIDWTP